MASRISVQAFRALLSHPCKSILPRAALLASAGPLALHRNKTAPSFTMDPNAKSFSSSSANAAAPMTSVATHNQYHTDGIKEDELVSSPIAMFDKWFKQALDSPDVPEPEAMTVCTTALASSSSEHTAFRGTACSSAPRPSARVVLLKQVDPKGFLFFSNYNSRKGKEIEANPWVSATFYWRALHKSVRICGKAEKLTKEESQKYFDSRPIGSRLGARASPQSQVIQNREQLEKLVREEEERFNVPGAAVLDGDEFKGEDKKVDVPDYWGGYRIVPDEIEFWCGRNNRLHDRFR